MLHNLTVEFYKNRLGLHDAIFVPIVHADAIVAEVYKVILSDGTEYILKISEQSSHFFKEKYCLELLAGNPLVPKIINEVEPQDGVRGAILMSCLPGHTISLKEFSPELAYESGKFLAQLHQHKMPGFGDFTCLQTLQPSARVHFVRKYEKYFDACAALFDAEILQRCKAYFYEHLYLLDHVEGPVLVHRDFRPGNMLVQDGKLCGFIDFASSAASFIEEDFIALELLYWSVDATSKEFFLEGYKIVRELPDYTKIMPLLCLVRAFNVLDFVVRTNIHETRSVEIYEFNKKYIEQFFEKKI